MGLAADLGRRLTELRDGLKRKQDEVAQRVRLSRSGLGYIERGEMNTRTEVLERLASVLGVDVADLFTFPWKPYPRHRARELIRLTPESEIAGLVEAMEGYLRERLPLAGLLSQKQGK
jgi:transcriptional regulator with XRE-family HTH domain